MTPVFPVLCICWMYALFKELSKPLSKRSITLIAIGNRNRGDDGIGLFIVEAIKDQLSPDIDVQIWEDKDALSVAAELLEIKTPIVIVDCADMGIKGGDFRWFKQSECSFEQHLNTISTHGFGFADALALAETLGFEQDLSFFAIQPIQLDFEHGISDVLEKNRDTMSKSLLAQLDKLKYEES